MASDSIVPLVLVTGFLGAGKTTLLQHVLPRLAATGIVPRVVINDYQNAMVDARTLQKLVAEVLPISGACVCCGSRDELLQALFDLAPEPSSLVLVEANGAADTLDLIEMLTADRRAARYTLPMQVVVVDTLRWQKRHWNNDVEAVQVRTANAVVFTRRDEVDDARSRAVVEDVRRLNPRAGHFTMETIVEWLKQGVARAASATPRRFEERREHLPRLGHERHHFASMELHLPRRVTRAALMEFLGALPKEVIRAKGVAALEEEPPLAVLFQKVEAGGPAMVKLGSPEGIDPVAIFIGPHLPASNIRTLAAQFGILLEDP
jgi:G3E family GTPase